VNSAARAKYPHLASGLIAAVLAAVGVTAGVLFCERFEAQNIHALATNFSLAKIQGGVLQKHAFAAPDLLVLYGSSELEKKEPNNANEFFRDYPSGFRVFPVGQPGTTALAVLQKIAAAGGSVEGRKVAYSISPGVYFAEVWGPEYYEGNFSHLQAYELAFSNHLSWDLKSDIARRMLDFPKTLEDDRLLEAALQRLAGDTLGDRILYAAMWPLGRLHTAIGRAQDHFQAAIMIDDLAEGSAEPKRRAGALTWKGLLQRAAKFANRAAIETWKREAANRNQRQLDRRKKATQTRRLMRKVSLAREWVDLELLIRTFLELGVEPLLLSMPVEDIRLDVYGVSAEARAAYLDRLHELATRYGVALADFREHQHDPAFLIDFHDHLSPEGWLHYNKAIDDFYHGRPLHP